MAVYTFNYSISNDTLNGTLDFSKLASEMEENLISYESLRPTGDNLRIIIDSELTAGELEIILDTIISEHDGEPIAEAVIYSLVGDTFADDEYTKINYKIAPEPNLTRSDTFVQGELRKVDWYTGETLVLTADMVYTRDPFGFATNRETTRTWYDTNGNALSKQTVRNKAYSSLDTIKEGKTRRGNIVSGIQLPVMGLMVETMTIAPYNLDVQTILMTGRDFLDRFESEFNKFIDNSSTVASGVNIGRKSVVVALEDAAASTDTWLNNMAASIGGQTSILAYLTSEFSI